MNNRFVDFISWGAAIIAGFVALYFLTAPPIMTAIAKSSGSASFPPVYTPILQLIESDYNGPVLWYFNDVWKCGIILIGEEEATPWPVVMLYGAVALVVSSALVFPLWRFYRKRKLKRNGC